MNADQQHAAMLASLPEELLCDVDDIVETVDKDGNKSINFRQTTTLGRKTTRQVYANMKQSILRKSALTDLDGSVLAQLDDETVLDPRATINEEDEEALFGDLAGTFEEGDDKLRETERMSSVNYKPMMANSLDSDEAGPLIAYANANSNPMLGDP